MAGRGSLGCAGVLIGVLAAAVLGWMALDLVLTLIGAAGGGLGGVLAEPLIAHQVGQLLVVATLLWVVFARVFGGIEGCPPLARGLLWSGAALELVAWLGLPDGSRLRTWALLMSIVGAATPLLVRGRGGTEHRPAGPGDPSEHA